MHERYSTRNRIFLQHASSIVDDFTENFLHVQLENPSSKISDYFDKYSKLEEGGYFFTIFIQEMMYLGKRVFGKKRDQRIISEVDYLINFLSDISNRLVADDKTETNFHGEYSRFSIVIAGKSGKIKESVRPYADYIRKVIVPASVENLYIIGDKKYEKEVKSICSKVSFWFNCVGNITLKKTIHFDHGDLKEPTVVYYLTSKNRELYRSSSSHQMSMNIQ